MSFIDRQIKHSVKVVAVATNDNTLAIAQLPKTMVKVINIKDLEFKDNLYYKRILYTKYSNITYDELVNGMVREKYSESEEFAILRKAMSGITEEFTTYNTYVEECKTQAKAWVTTRDSLV